MQIDLAKKRIRQRKQGKKTEGKNHIPREKTIFQGKKCCELEEKV